MSLKNKLIHALTILLHGESPVYKTTANIAILAPNQLLNGRCALITGGTGGIGREIAKAFVMAGAKVVISGRAIDKVREECLKIAEETGVKNKIYGVEMDTTVITLMDSCLNEVYEIIGRDNQLDILVNCAGILGGIYQMRQKRNMIRC